MMGVSRFPFLFTAKFQENFGVLFCACSGCWVTLMTVCDVMVCWKGVFGKEANLEI